VNIDQFRHMLGAMVANDVPTGASAGTRLDRVKAKIARTRRARATAGVGGLAVVVAAAALAAPAIDRDRDPSRPAATRGEHTRPIDLTPTDLPTVTDKGTVFYKDAADMRLIGHEVADPGHRWLSLSVTPPTLDLSYNIQCWRLEDPAAPAQFSTFVNGHRLNGGAGVCDLSPYGPLSGLDPNDRNSPAANKAKWARLGVVAGEPTQIRMHVRGRAADIAHTQLVFALFTAGGRSRVSTTWYPTEVVFKGHEYRSHGAKTRMFTGRHWVLRHNLAPSDNPYFVWAGTLQMHATGIFRLVGRSGVGGSGSGARVSGLFRSERSPVKATFRGEPRSSGRLWMAVYRQTR
jgi:hypothetical protein